VQERIPQFYVIEMEKEAPFFKQVLDYELLDETSLTISVFSFS